LLEAGGEGVVIQSNLHQTGAEAVAGRLGLVLRILPGCRLRQDGDRRGGEAAAGDLAVAAQQAQTGLGVAAETQAFEFHFLALDREAGAPAPEDHRSGAAAFAQSDFAG